jgi:hypothetical protein
LSTVSPSSIPSCWLLVIGRSQVRLRSTSRFPGGLLVSWLLKIPGATYERGKQKCINREVGQQSMANDQGTNG